MDINLEYDAHQHGAMRAGYATSSGERLAQLTRASSMAGGISGF
jgi:hypothetical protein